MQTYEDLQNESPLVVLGVLTEQLHELRAEVTAHERELDWAKIELEQLPEWQEVQALREECKKMHNAEDRAKRELGKAAVSIWEQDPAQDKTLAPGVSVAEYKRFSITDPDNLTVWAVQNNHILLLEPDSKAVKAIKERVPQEYWEISTSTGSRISSDLTEAVEELRAAVAMDESDEIAEEGVEMFDQVDTPPAPDGVGDGPWSPEEMGF